MNINNVLNAVVILLLTANLIQNQHALGDRPLSFGQTSELKKLAANGQSAEAPSKKNVSSQELLIKKMMRAVHRGSGSPLLVLKAEAISKKPDWTRVVKSVQFFEIMADMLHETGKKSRTYVAASADLTVASKEQNMKKVADAIASISASCTGCHGWGGAPK